MLAESLRFGDAIGIVSPSHVAREAEYQGFIEALERRGFRVKTGENLYKATYGYLATEQERAEDFNRMVLDDEIKLIFFGGGEGSVELLPLIDYDAVKAHPKLFLSYSDGTSILNAIYTKTGLVTYYGQSPGEFDDLRQYTWEQFTAHLMRRDAGDWVANSKWHCLCRGVGEGLLIGGYTENFVRSLDTPYLTLNPKEKYLLFLEDHEQFSHPGRVSVFLSCIEQNPFINQVTGLLFGHYSETNYPALMERLKRFGEKHGIPVAYCDDFGHGKNHAILPVGYYGVLNTAENNLRMLAP